MTARHPPRPIRHAAPTIHHVAHRCAGRTGLAGMALLVGLAGLAATAPAQAESFDCLIEPYQTVDLRSPVDGLIDKVLVQRGDRVRTGQPLVLLESSVETSAQEVARYRAQTEGRIATARSRVDYAGKKLARQTELQASNYVAAQSRDEAEAEKRVAEAELTDALESRELAQREYKQSTDQLGRRTLRCPFNGVVMDRMLNPGDLAESGTGRRPVLKLARVEPLRVEVVLPVAAYGKLAQGTTASVTPEGIGGRYPATVGVIDSASGTFGVRLVLANPDRQLPAGIRCRIDFPQLRGLPARPAKAMVNP